MPHESKIISSFKIILNNKLYKVFIRDNSLRQGLTKVALAGLE